jgi:hypothetical protein
MKPPLGKGKWLSSADSLGRWEVALAITTYSDQALPDSLGPFIDWVSSLPEFCIH